MHQLRTRNAFHCLLLRPYLIPRPRLIVSSVAMSSSCPDEDVDCIVAVKFLGPTSESQTRVSSLPLSCFPREMGCSPCPLLEAATWDRGISGASPSCKSCDFKTFPGRERRKGSFWIPVTVPNTWWNLHPASLSSFFGTGLPPTTTTATIWDPKVLRCSGLTRKGMLLTLKTLEIFAFAFQSRSLSVSSLAPSLAAIST